MRAERLIIWNQKRMSAAIVGRVVVLAFAAVAATIAYVKYKNGQRQQHHQQGSRGGPPPGDDDRPRYRKRGGGSSWENDQDDIDMVRSRTQTKSPSSSSDDKGCPICLEPYSKLTKRGMLLMSTPCGHIFCKTCLDECFTRSRLCPFCRVEIDRSMCHPIYL